MSTGERDDLWTLNEQKKEPQYQMHVLTADRAIGKGLAWRS